MKPSQVFAREATGLVREFGWREVFLISAGMQGASFFSVGSQIIYVGTATPSADILLSTFLGFCFSLPLGLAYYMMSTALPRSGGDYVWMSRVTIPILGVAAGWAYWIYLLMSTALAAWFGPGVLLGQSLTSLGISLGNPGLVEMANWFTSSTNVFLFALVTLVFAFLVGGMGSKLLSRVMIIMFALQQIGTLAAYIVLATSTQAGYVNAIAGYGGTNLSYQGVIEQARQLGWSSSLPFQMSLTIQSLPLSVLLYIGFLNSTGASGEVRHPRRSMVWGILGVLIFGAIVNMIGIYLCLNVFGYDFLSASNFLASNGKWPLASPWIGLLIAPLIKNAAVMVLVQIAWSIAGFFGAIVQGLVATRYTFAFAFDRVLPTKLAEVNERYHFPVYATILNFVISACLVAVIIFTSLVWYVLNGVSIASAVWFLGSVAAIVLPYSRFKDVAKTLPGGTWRVPLLTIFGTLSAICMALTFYWSVTTPAIGPTGQAPQLFLLSLFVLGAIVYGASYLYNKTRGIDLRLSYAQIPPE
jgi:amino acid transporter